MNNRNPTTPFRRRSLWSRTALFGAGLALVGTTNAQITSYSRTVLSSQTYVQISGGTVINTNGQLTHATLGATGDDGGVIVTLPFTFVYNGNAFTTATFCTNGWVGMGSQPGVTFSQGRTGSNLFSATAPNNTIGGWFGDGNANFANGGSMVHGTVGTGVYAFEWRNVAGVGSTPTATNLINYMVKLYGPASASPGRIELLYGTTAGSTSTGRTNGIEDAAGGVNHYINALNGLSNNAATNSAWPGNGNGYRFDAPCTELVTMELRTDALSIQASWQIIEQNTNAVLCQFLVPINGITSPITESCCLPVGCYRLRVMDAGGDGFVSGGITGGYQLRESGANGRRIIDNFGNFTNLAGGPPDVSAIANTYDNGAFCVPVGDDRPIFSSCDKQDWVANQYIVATENASVSTVFTASPINSVANTTSGYEFWFFDPNGTYSFRRFRNHATTDGYGTGAIRACHFRLNSWTNTVSTPWLPNNVLLNVRIRGRVNGNNLPFGPACLFKMDATRAACPLVKLQDNPGNVADYSCGVSRVFGGANSGANKLVANPPQFSPALPDASTLRYQFRFRLPDEYPNAGSCIVRPIQTSPTLYMNWTTGDKLKCNTQYQVDLRVSKDGGATWCVADGESTCSATPTIWGKVCNVNITTSTYCPGPAQGEGSNLVAEGNSTFSMYPNPNRGDQLFLSLSNVEAGVHTVSVDIYDLTGKRAMARTIPVQDGFLKTNLDLNPGSGPGQVLATGMYMVNITAGEKTYTQRLVIQH